LEEGSGMTLTRARLSDQQRADRSLTEADFQRAVTDLAALLGWSWVHFRPAQTARGWRTPVSGPLGQGWPDLVLVSPLRRRVLAVELKRELGAVSPDQQYVHGALEMAGLTVRVWRPSDLTSGEIEQELRRPR
jgi:VRR-NUC domain-containing protein